MKTTNCVVAVLIRNGFMLVEKRSVLDELDSGRVAFPCGHIEPNENAEHALIRECQEELHITPINFTKFYQSNHNAGKEIQDCVYYLVTKWTGNLIIKDKLFVVPISTMGLDLLSDKNAIEFLIDSNLLIKKN